MRSKFLFSQNTLFSDDSIKKIRLQVDGGCFCMPPNSAQPLLGGMRRVPRTTVMPGRVQNRRGKNWHVKIPTTHFYQHDRPSIGKETAGVSMHKIQ